MCLLEEILHRAHVLSLSRNDELNVGDDEVVSSEVAEGGDTCGKVRGMAQNRNGTRESVPEPEGVDGVRPGPPCIPSEPTINS